MSISTKQAQAYLDRRGHGCPACGDFAIESDSYDILKAFPLESGTIYQRMTCTACGEEWDDAYELNRIVEILDAEWTGQ